MRFSAGEAAFEGFRVTRHHPAAVGAWALVSIVTLIAMAATALPVLGPALGELKTVVASGAELPLPLQLRLLQAAVVVVPLNLVSQAILMPAIYRASGSDRGDRFGFVRLGRDELRVLGVLVLLTLISLVVGQAGGLLSGLAAAAGLGVIGGVIEFATMIFSFYVSVRLVLAAPAAFATGRIDLRSAWLSTRGLFWPLLGLAIMAGVMAIIVTLLLSIVALPLSNAAGGFAALTPVTVVAGAGLVALGGLVMALSMTIVSAPFMAAWRDMTSAH